MALLRLTHAHFYPWYFTLLSVVFQLQPWYFTFPIRFQLNGDFPHTFFNGQCTRCTVSILVLVLVLVLLLSVLVLVLVLLLFVLVLVLLLLLLLFIIIINYSREEM